MTNKTFSKLLKRFFSKIADTLDRKGVEYTSNGNRLGNFTKIADRRKARGKGVSDFEALLSLQDKQAIGVEEIVESLENPNNPIPSLAHINEKFLDTINYYLLLWAMVIEHCEYTEVEIVDNQDEYKEYIDKLDKKNGKE